MKQKFKTKFTSAHFRLLRTAKRDYKIKSKRLELTTSCAQETQNMWANFITASKVIKIVRDCQPKDLYLPLMSTYFEGKRQPGCGFFYDRSQTKKGRKSLKNRLLFMKSFTNKKDIFFHS